VSDRIAQSHLVVLFCHYEKVIWFAAPRLVTGRGCFLAVGQLY